MTGFVMESDCADHYTIGLYPKVKTKQKLLKSEICAPLQDPRSLAYMRQWGCTTGNAAPVATATFYVLKENKAEKIP
jgi:hypothetical protein